MENNLFIIFYWYQYILIYHAILFPTYIWSLFFSTGPLNLIFFFRFLGVFYYFLEPGVFKNTQKAKINKKWLTGPLKNLQKSAQNGSKFPKNKKKIKIFLFLFLNSIKHYLRVNLRHLKQQLPDLFTIFVKFYPFLVFDYKSEIHFSISRDGDVARPLELLWIYIKIFGARETSFL